MARVTLIRHAAVLIELAGCALLVDPLLDPAGAQPPVEDTANPARNPLVELPEAPEALIERADAVCLTHLHVDHLGTTAAKLLAGRRMPVFCQPPDAARLRELHIGDPLIPVATSTRWRMIEIARTDGRHGRGHVAELLGPVSGFVLRADAAAVYVAGDTIWCDEVRDAIDRYAPEVTIVNAGAARLLEGGTITMDADDVIAVARHVGGAVVAVHMEAYNHCALSRAELRVAAAGAGVEVWVPADGESLRFPAGAGGVDRALDSVPAP